MVLSPDGRSLVFSAVRDGRQHLYLRPLSEPEATPIAGTEEAYSPFFSPDGRWLGFWVGGGHGQGRPVEGGISAGWAHGKTLGRAPELHGSSSGAQLGLGRYDRLWSESRGDCGAFRPPAETQSP